jgi:hypothetical protein
MAFPCRDENCLRPFNRVEHRTTHEKMMHPSLVKDAARKLIQRIIAMNSVEQCQKKVITADGNKYSYYEALAKSKDPQTEEEKAVLAIFEGIVTDFFLEQPEQGVRELLTTRDYKIRSQ